MPNSLVSLLRQLSIAIVWPEPKEPKLVNGCSSHAKRFPSVKLKSRRKAICSRTVYCEGWQSDYPHLQATAPNARISRQTLCLPRGGIRALPSAYVGVTYEINESSKGCAGKA